MGYNSDSATDRLSAVRAAIAACLEAQSYSVAGRSKQMAMLQTLREMEKELIDEVAGETTSRISLIQIDKP